MVYLSIENDTKDLYLFINSPGGWVIPGVAIYDTMQFVQPPFDRKRRDQLMYFKNFIRRD
ncbi:hypothetical protein E1A91_A09G110300v1 [Gossypium mustelinum]|uniref:ATP-dependent Clp protease proteolytic subunit n=1 Tax=Gossypium mustelinum TaxID=34275 RepID=A0A5D2XWL8_GOSMU|nr:hypothetical protein E1A91_A09G110300v1 [Gossypium mustelinum]